MKDFRPPSEQWELIAQWGEAQLVKTFGGKYELHGGTPDDRENAAAWIRAHYPQAAYVLDEAAQGDRL